MIQQITTLGTYGGPVPLAYSGEPFMSVMSFILPLAGPLDLDFSPVSPSQRCQETDQGVSIVIQVVDSAGVPVNLRAASLLSIITKRPSGIVVNTPATRYTNGFDGRMCFVSDAILPYGTGLGEVGVWNVQGKITLGGNTQYTTTGAFISGKNLGV